MISKILHYLPFVLIQIIINNSPVTSQVMSSFWIHVYDGIAPTDTTSMIFGNHSNASYCIDSLSPIIQEIAGPPISPGYDTRWVRTPGRDNCFGYGLIRYNFIPFPNNFGNKDTFALYFSNLGYPDSAFYFSWPDSSFLRSKCDSMFLVESTGNIPPINMFKQQFLKVNSPGSQAPQIDKFYIYKFGIRGIDTVLPTYNNAIAGSVFNDLNANGVQDVDDTTMSDWNIVLKNSNQVIIDSLKTDSHGYYRFGKLPSGTFFICETQKSQWIQTYPTGLGIHKIAISSDSLISGIDFGNTYGYRYIGPNLGNWSDSANWTGGKPPNYDNAVIIPENICVIADSLPNDSIKALQIKEGGKLDFVPSVSELKVKRSIYIENGSTLQFPETSDTTGLVCYKDFINRGTVEPGHSAITFDGNVPKIIASEGNGTFFYKLEIKGDSTYSIGNISINDKLIIKKVLTPQVTDTIFINSNDTAAIQDTGVIYQGTISRTIKSGETNAYRFESQNTYLEFDGSGVNPTAITFTTLPDTMTPCTRFRWEIVESTLDTVNNTISADSINSFSKWRMGIPRVHSDEPQIGIKREYIIRQKDGNNFHAQMQLSYEQSEILPGIDEGGLKLLRGPWYVDSVLPDWRMLAPPLVPENDLGAVMFPGASSPFYGYNGSEYHECTNLEFGKGYWAKFDSIRHFSILGDDRNENKIIVTQGWNLIGVMSYKLFDAETITSVPEGIISSNFYGYRKGYYQADSLIPMNAYWVKVDAPGLIILKSDEIEENIFSKANVTPKDQRLSKLTLLDDNGNEQVLYYSTSVDKSINTTLFNLPPLPPHGAFDVRFSTGTMLEIVDGNKQREVPIMISSARYPLTIRSEFNKDESKGNARLRIGDKLTLLMDGGTIIVHDSLESVSLLITAENNTELPKGYALQQNYPNPFNPTATIRYQLPEDSKVSLKVYNTLGQLVIKLTDEVEAAGFKSVEWNGSNVASGVYFYRIDATSMSDPSKTFTQVRKMLLVK